MNGQSEVIVRSEAIDQTEVIDRTEVGVRIGVTEVIARTERVAQIEAIVQTEAIMAARAKADVRVGRINGAIGVSTQNVRKPSRSPSRSLNFSFSRRYQTHPHRRLCRQ